MTADQSMLPSSDDEIDLREVFAAMQRRWRWVFGGGFLGLALAAGLVSMERSEASLLSASLVVDISKSPCRLLSRKARSFSDISVLRSLCDGEYQAMRFMLNRIAKDELESFANKYSQFEYKIAPLSFGARGREKSSTHLNLSLTSPIELRSEISAALGQIRQKINAREDAIYSGNVSNANLSADWIVVQEPSEIDVVDVSRRWLALGMLGGLVMGAGSALIADRRSNRVFSREDLLRRLNQPLRLSLPAASLTASAVEVLVGQLATQLDHSLSWRVLSIARQHEAVEPLSKLLQQQGGADLQCESADPLLSAVLRFEPRDQPTGLLVVVEPGFNSARALEEARLLISQMSNVQDVGVVLVGTPLPEELSSSVVG